ncbi:MAG: hypothetical protein ACI9HH_000554, partial [Pseudomonadota bacterium]
MPGYLIAPYRNPVRGAQPVGTEVFFVQADVTTRESKQVAGTTPCA